MPFGEKLKLIKEDRGLTNKAIHEKCDVPLSTVIRVFDEETPSGNFETFAKLAAGLDFSLDELAGLKPPCSVDPKLLEEKDATIASYIEMIKEKDAVIKSYENMIKEKDVTINTYSELLKEKAERISELKEEKNQERRSRIKLSWSVVGLVAAILAIVVSVLILLAVHMTHD